MRWFVVACSLALASMGFAQLADSVWPCAQGPRLDYVVPLDFSAYPSPYVWPPTVAVYRLLGAGDFLCDEDGNYYVASTGASGLSKLTSEFDVVWRQDDALQPIAIRADGSVLARGPNGSGLRVLRSDGSVAASAPPPPISGTYLAALDGGVYVVGSNQCARYGPDLTLMFGASYAPVLDRDGQAWASFSDSGKYYIGKLDETGAISQRLDISSYGPGMIGGTLVGLGPGPSFYVSAGTNGQYPGCLAALDATGSLLWFDPNPSVLASTTRSVLVSPLGDVFYGFQWTDQYGAVTALSRRGLDGSRINLPSGQSWSDSYDRVALQRIDATSDLFYTESKGSNYGGYSTGGTYLVDKNDTFLSFSFVSGASGPTSGTKAWGWGYHPDGYIVWSYDKWDQGGSGSLTYRIGPHGIIRSAADVDVRGGTANSLTYRFRLRKPGGDTMVKRRGHSSGSFTWEFHSSPGTFEVLASADCTLWQKQTVTVDTSPVDLSFALPVGDLNGDNVINLLDIAAWFQEPVDLNNDGHAGIADLSLILLNFDMVGDE